MCVLKHDVTLLVTEIHTIDYGYSIDLQGENVFSPCLPILESSISIEKSYHCYHNIVWKWTLRNWLELTLPSLAWQKHIMCHVFGVFTVFNGTFIPLEKTLYDIFMLGSVNLASINLVIYLDKMILT